MRRSAISRSAARLSQLQDLVDKWFLGEDLPTIDMQNLSGESVSYAPASGTLFGSGGPSYQDVFQGRKATAGCWHRSRRQPRSIPRSSRVLHR